MNKIDYNQTLNNLRAIGFSPNPNLVQISIPEAGEILFNGIKFFCGESAKWLPEYEQIVTWLTNNNGRGLLCLGNCGRGKSVICTKVLPLLLHHYGNRILSIYDAQKMNDEIDLVKSKHIVCIDDLGTEGLSVKYGEKRLAFAELADEAEKKGKLLIATTNLSLAELKTKYGERTIDRLRAITMPVVFKGDSLRR